MVVLKDCLFVLAVVDNALGTIEQERYEQMSQKYSEEYYTLKTELAEIKEQLSAFENAGGRRRGL